MAHRLIRFALGFGLLIAGCDDENIDCSHEHGHDGDDDDGDNEAPKKDCEKP